jgi:hypothetical protein
MSLLVLLHTATRPIALGVVLGAFVFGNESACSQETDRTALRPIYAACRSA